MFLLHLLGCFWYSKHLAILQICYWAQNFSQQLIEMCYRQQQSVWFRGGQRLQRCIDPISGERDRNFWCRIPLKIFYSVEKEDQISRRKRSWNDGVLLEDEDNFEVLNLWKFCSPFIGLRLNWAIQLCSTWERSSGSEWVGWDHNIKE